MVKNIHWLVSSGCAIACEQSHNQSRKSEYLHSDHPEEATDPDSDFHDSSVLLQFLRFIQLSIGQLCILVCILDVLFNFVEIPTLLYDQLIDIFHDSQIVLHLFCNLIELLWRNLNLGGSDLFH